MPTPKNGMTPHAKIAYGKRNAVLRDLGFPTYQCYLYSELWTCIREKILITGARCRACGKKATQVHHNRYEREDMLGTCLDHLIPVCGYCHRQSEFTQVGKAKLAPHEATNKLDTMRRANQARWRAEDAKDAWEHFFHVLTSVRIHLGMDESFEARTLVESLDAAQRNLPSNFRRKKKKQHHRRGITP